MKSQEEEQLKAVRNKIDSLDTEIQDLITQRAKCAMDVAVIKSQALVKNVATKDSERPVFYRPEREAQVLLKVKERNKKRNKSVLPDDEMARLFREIMSACLALEHQLNVAYLGPKGSYTYSAALKHFGHSAKTISAATIDEVFREVESGSVNYGVVPVENSTEGMVNQSMDLFVNASAQICGEVQLRIHHSFMSLVTDMKNIKVIYSHQQSLAQCRGWLSANMPGVECVAKSSNAEAARCAAEDMNSAAIAGIAAAEQYELPILASNIEDEAHNTTRFLIIGQQKTQASGKDKTSLLLSVHNSPGALYSLLEPFSNNSVSMTRVESRPSKLGMGDYVFFIDIEGHIEDENIKVALNEVNQHASMVKMLGSYPRAVI